MKHSSILTILFILFVTGAQAQNKYVAKGDKMMKKFRIEKAARFYKKAADADINDLAAREKLANTFMVMEDYASAEAIYGSLVGNPAAASINKYYYAQAMALNGKYDEADKMYKEYAKANPNDPRAAEFANYKDRVAALTQDNKVYELISIPENSSASDLAVAYLNKNIVITSNRNSSSADKDVDFWNSKSYYDILTLGTSDSFTSSPKKIKGKIDKRFNEGPVTFSADGKEMIFTRSNYKKKSAGGVRMLGLYHADYDEKKGWVNVTPLSVNGATYNVAHPSLSKDGTQLFFISDMPGGQGETDIYVSLKQGSDWGQPINLGPDVNTPGREMFPFIADDGTLFFSSDSRVGLGGLDIYSTTLSGNSKWVNVTNLGAPINSSSDDFAYVSDETGRHGYMSSNRPGGLGDDDIYKFNKRTESTCGTVAEQRTGNTLEGVVITATTASGEVVQTRTNAKGDFCLGLMPGRTYKITGEKDGFVTYEGSVTPKAGKNERLSVLMKAKGGIDLTVDVSEKAGEKLEGATVYLINKNTGEVDEKKSGSDGTVTFDVFPNQEYDIKVSKKVGNQEGAFDRFMKTISTMGFQPSQKITQKATLTYYEGKFVFDLPNVFFEYGSPNLKQLAKVELDKVAQVMKTFPDMEVELSSHTDCRGSAEYNLELSALRAQSCVVYLESKGVQKKRLLAIGYGEERIKNKCVDGVECTEPEHSINRRSEFKVLKLD